MSSTRIRQFAYFGIPLLLCLAVHWYGMKMWFYGDDFAWLGLRLEVTSPKELFRVLFEPQAQGTVRTLSERLFFLVLSSIFGLEAAPFRIWVFLTQFANIVLLSQITRRLTGSATAGFLAPVLWTVNAGLAFALHWNSAYNEIAFAFVVLLSFYLWLKHIDTGQRKYWIWQWVVFLLGFGVLELNVVYPALAAGYALCCARPYFRKSLLLFIPSILFTIAHFVFVPPTTDTHYQMFIGPSVLHMLWIYWSFAMGAVRDAPVDWRPQWLGISLTIAVTISLLAFAFQKLRRREWLPVFLIGWFFVVAGPILPLKNHFTEYYVSVPVIGLTILGAWAIAEARGPLAVVAVILTATYLLVAIVETRLGERYFYDRSRRIKYLMKALEDRPKADAGKVLLFQGIDNEFFWLAFYGDPFRLIGISQVYLAPGTETAIDPHPEWGGISRFVISRDDAFDKIHAGKAELVELQGRHLKDLSKSFLASYPYFIDVADPIYQSRLGKTWYAPEGSFRWMPKTATVRLGGPNKPGESLVVSGFCPAVAMGNGPIDVSFQANRIKLGSTHLTKPDAQFEARFPLPRELIGVPAMEIEIEVSRVTKIASDPRDFGLIFGTFAIQ